MKKRIISIALVLAMTAGLAACGQKTSETKSPSQAQAKTEAAPDASEQPQTDAGAELPEVKLVFSTQSSGDVNYVKAMHMIADEISEKTNGKFTMEIHENGSLMTQEGEVDAVARGSLDMMFSSPFLISDQMPYLTMFTAAYIFQNEQHMRAVMDGEIGQKVADDVAEKLNVRWLSALYCGARHLDMRDIGREITKPEDLNGVNLRMPNSSAWLFMGKALGANPTPMAYAEIYQGLQTGAIDGQENPIDTIYDMKFHEVQTDITKTNHSGLDQVVLINKAWYDGLDADIQEAITQGVKQGGRVCLEETLALAEKDEKLIADTGKTAIHELDDEQKAAWRTAMVPVQEYARTSQGAEGEKIYDAIVAARKEITGEQ